MTHDEIDKLEAGPEMDVLVAERVMRWEQSMVSPCNFLGETGVILGFKPSKDISSAWEVLLKMHANGYDWGIDADEVYFQKGDNTAPDFRCGTALNFGIEKMPFAICKAALKAVSA